MAPGGRTMRRTTGWLSIGCAAVATLLGASPSHAECHVPQAAMNFFANISACPDSHPVAGFIAVVGSAATINNNGIQIICEDVTDRLGDGNLCAQEIGPAGDGRVAIQFDWSNPDLTTQPWRYPIGCPDPLGLPGIGRNFVQVVCNDGASAIVTVDYDIGLAGYNMDFPSRLDPATGTYTMRLPDSGNGLAIASAGSSGGVDTVCVGRTGAVPVFSDCDPESIAFQYGVGCDTPAPAVAPGADLYLATGPATSPPIDLRVTAWTLQATTPGPDGSRCVAYPTPAAGACAWIGTTAVVAGEDTGAIAAWVTTCDVPVLTDQVRIDSAVLVRGRLQVEFTTTNETLITGFDLYGGSLKINDAPIPAKGRGSQTYLFDVGRGALKSSRTVVVEALKSDGTVVQSEPVDVR